MAPSSYYEYESVAIFSLPSSYCNFPNLLSL